MLSTDEVTFWSVTGQKLASYNIVLPGGNGASNPPSIVFQMSVANYYFGGKLVGHSNSGSISIISSDRLGSIGKYYPYGQEKPSATTNGTEKFTGYFRDSETGLDYADQRYHNPGTGRFLTPDPYMAATNGGNDPSNPGSWNRYAYVAGDPINYYDPAGEYMAIPAPGTEWTPPATPISTTGASMFLSLESGGGEGSGGFAGTKWDKAQTRLSNANVLVQNLDPSGPCQQDLNKIASAPGGKTLDQIEQQINISNWVDATTSTHLEANLFTPGTSAYDYWAANGTTIQQFFKNSPGTGAETALTISGSSLNIYFRPSYVLSHSAGYDAALLMHEALHSLGWDDDQVKAALGLREAQCGSGTACISKLLAQDCFGANK